MDESLLNDKDLEIRAVTNPVAREELQFSVRPAVLNQVKHVSALRNISKGKETELVNIGMSMFDHAFNVYIKNGSVFDEAMNFSPYLAWWARQAIVKYLEE
jgi:hypothetical protein